MPEVEVVGEERQFLPMRVEHVPAPVTLYGTTDPADIVRLATAQADALAPVIESKGLYASMGSAGNAPCAKGHERCAKTRGGPCTERRHVLYEGWALCGTLLGVFATVVHTEPLLDAEGCWQPAIVTEEWVTVDGKRKKQTTVVQKGRGGWKATAHAVTRDGAVVGADDAVCTWDELRWEHRTSAEVLGMAQTRAKSRALRGPLGFVVALAGYVATPAEEMAPAVPALLVPLAEGQVADFGPYLASVAPSNPDGQAVGALKRWAYDLAGGNRDVAAAAFAHAMADALGDVPVEEWGQLELLQAVAPTLAHLLHPQPGEQPLQAAAVPDVPPPDDPGQLLDAGPAQPRPAARRRPAGGSR